MPATKSGNHIYITGTGNTLDSIVADIADTNYIYQDRPNHAVVNGSSVNRYLDVRNGGELIIGDETSFTGSYTLEFKTHASVAGYGRLMVSVGGSLYVYGDSLIDLGSGSQRADASYIYGKTYVTGSDVHKPIIQNATQIRFYENQNNNTYVNDIWTFNNVIFGSAFLDNWTVLAFYQMSKVRYHTFTNLLFDKSYGKNQNCRVVSFMYPHPSYNNMKIENWVIDYGGGTNQYKLMGTCQSILKNITIGKDCSSWKVDFSRPPSKYSGIYTGSFQNAESYESSPVFGQTFGLLDGWTFQTSSATTLDMLVRYGAKIAIKDCTFDETSGTRFYLDGQSELLIWSGNTYSGGQTIIANSNINNVYDLTLVVQDKQGNPIQNALVYIRQNQGYEEYIFQTKANGKLNNCLGLEVALLTNLNRFATSSTRYWSDSSNNTYHEVTVLKSGYRPIVKTYIMDQVREDTIILDRIDARSLAF